LCPNILFLEFAIILFPVRVVIGTMGTMRLVYLANSFLLSVH
jgi:hypothetical protein